MKHKKKKTASDLIAHFARRCLERLGCTLNTRCLKSMMAEHKLSVLGKHSNTKTLFLLHKSTYTERELPDDIVLAYDRTRHEFVTVMLYTSWKTNHDEEGRRTDGGSDQEDTYCD